MKELSRVMALDVGDARVGIALSDQLGMTARPLETMNRRGREDFDELVNLARREGVKEIVIGLPLLLNGERGDQALKVERFADELRQALQVSSLEQPVEVKLWDERLTTTQAERFDFTTKLRGKERRARLDQLSAALILTSYLQSKVING